MSAEKHKTVQPRAYDRHRSFASALSRRRDLRLRTEGKAQYVEVAGGFARYLEDPWADPGFAREAVNEETEVLIVVALRRAVCAARVCAKLASMIPHRGKGRGFRRHWYWNRYRAPPAILRATSICRCWKRPATCRCAKYARAPEITNTPRRIGRHFGLYERALFQTSSRKWRGSRREGRWLVETDRGRSIRARFVILPAAR